MRQIDLTNLFPILLLLIMVCGTQTMVAQDANQAKADAKAKMSLPFPEFADKRCGSTEYNQWLQATNPGKVMSDAEFEIWLSDEMAKIGQYKLQKQLYTVPVIFHIVHAGGAVGTGDNISKIYVDAQIEQLNNDFRKIAGTSGDNSDPDGADSEIEFCPAALDENGNVLAEPGINRVSASSAGLSNPPFTTNYCDSNVKPATGWNPDNYFNIWVCNISGGVLGYAQFPSNSGLGGLGANGGPANTDGVVCLYSSIGSTTTPYPNAAPYNKGRTLTHEAGHWFGLRHIWGDGGCGTDDFCNDTPDSDGSNFGCPNVTNCGSLDMVENYMDYTDDDCMNVFTNDQKARMQTVMSISPQRASLANSTVCNTMPAPPVANFSANITYSCVTPATIQFNDNSSGFPAVTSWSWDFPGGTPATSTDQNPVVTYNTPGLYTVTLTVTNSEGNNTVTQTDYIEVGTPPTGIAAPVTEPFQAATFPPAGWTIDNPDGSFTWERTTTVGYNSTASMYLNYWDYNASGEVDEMILPGIDVSGLTDTELTFDLAYSLYEANMGFSDTLEILVSNDCGASFTSVYKKFDTNLTTVPDHLTEFFPANDGEWRNEVVDLSAFDGSTSLEVIFKGTSNYENNLFVDNINIDGSTTMQAPAADFAFTTSNTACEEVTVQFTDNSTNNPTSWNWTFAGGTPATSTAQNPSVVYSAAGTYDVILVATNATGDGTNTKDGIITVSPALSSAVTSTNVDCNGDSDGTASVTVATGTAPYAYDWSDGQVTAIAIGLAAGTYDVTTTDAAGCVDVKTATIGQPDALVASGTATATSCGLDNGAASVSVSGGTVGYTVNWSNGMTGSTITGLPAGTYTADVLDNNGCSTSETVTVGGSTGISATTTSTPASCTGNDGTATANPSGGAGAYLYEWSDTQMTQTAISLAAGAYTVTITDADGCETVESVTVGNTSGLSTTSNTTPAGCGTADGTATVMPAGGTAPYTILWSDGQMTQTAVGLAGGTYTVNITDDAGCVLSETVVVGSSAGISATSTTTPSNCGQADGSATVMPTGGSGTYTVVWSDGETGTTATGLAQGTYDASISDGSSCSYTETVTITGSTALTLNTSSSDASCGLDNGSASAAANGGNGTFTYAWSNGQTGPAINNVSAGTYTVTATDGTGCTSTKPVTVGGTPAVSASISSVAVTCNSTNDGTATVNAMTGTAPFTYPWSDGQTGQTAVGLTAGSYSVVVMDAAGCEITATVTVAQTPPVSATITPVDVACGAMNNGSATANAAGGTAPFTYQWSNNAVAPAIGNLAEGTYTVTITDANGCSTIETTTIADPNMDLMVAASVLIIDLYTSDSTITFTDNTPGATSWEWNFGDGSPVSTLQNPTHLYPEVGTYTVTVIVSNGTCTQGETITVTVEDTTPVIVDPPNAVGDVEGLTGFEVYPNPTTGLFHIDMNLATRSDLNVRVVNTLGQTLISDDLGEVQGELLKSYDLRSFAHGIYFVTITDGSGTATKRLFFNW